MDTQLHPPIAAVKAGLVGGLSRVLDLCFPRLCPLCGEVSDRAERLICWHCFARLPLHTVEDAVCRCCGLAPEGKVDEAFLCEVCRLTPPQFDRARAAAPFRGGIRVMLHDFKYNHATWLRADLVDLLEGALRTYYDPTQIDLVLPVPLHASRQRKRSYNQAALLAASLARRLRLEMRADLVRRSWSTPTQTRLNARARRENVRGAFRLTQPEWTRGRTLLVIDDVMTTGATLDAVARCLKAGGAWRVWALAAARG